MRGSLLAAAATVALLAAGCSSPDRPEQSTASLRRMSGGRLRTGMTAEEARTTAGRPLSIEQQDCASRQTVWRFADGGVAILRNGRVAFHYP